MKKLLAITLALTLVLSLNVSAFAKASPSGGGSSDNVPVDTTEVVYGPTTGKAAPTVVTRAVEKNGTETVTLTEEQEKQVDTAIANAIADGNAVVEAIIVDAPAETSDSNPATIIIPLQSNEIILLYSLDGRLLKTLTAKELKAVGGDTYEIELSESCIVVIAKQ